MPSVNKAKFTKKYIEGLRPQERRYNRFDSDTRGLAIVVHPSGEKTFFHLKKVQGWPQRVTLEKFPDMSLEDARAEAAAMNSKLSRWKTAEYEGANPIDRPKKISKLG